MKTLQFLFFLFFCLKALTINSQVKNYGIKGESVKIFGEQIELEVKAIPTEVGNLKESGGLAGAIGSIVPFIYELTSHVIDQAIEKKLKKYTGEFSAKTSEEAFYSFMGKANLPQITIKRYIRIKNKDTKTLGCTIVLVPEVATDGSAFRYRVGSYEYHWMKAKTKRRFDRIDIQISLGFQYISIDSGKYEIKPMRNVSIDLVQITADGKEYKFDPKPKDKYTAYSEWIPFPSYPKFGQKEKIELINKEVETLKKYTITENQESGKPDTLHVIRERTNITNQKTDEVELCKNCVVYEIAATVKEVNPYKVKSEQNKEFFKRIQFEEDSAMLGKILETIFTKEKNAEEVKD